MPSSFSTSCRLTLQAPGEGLNLWGTINNTGVIALIDASIAGWKTIALTGNYTLTTANGASDEARSAMLKFTGTGAFVVTTPGVSKSYIVWNACSAALTMSAGGAASAIIQPGEHLIVHCDGANVYRVQATDMGGSKLTNIGSPTNSGDACTKGYADSLAFAAVDLPGQTGNAGKYLTTDGTNASWGAVSLSYASTSDVQAGTSTAAAVTPAALIGAVGFGALTDASTIGWDTATKGPHATVTITANRTMGAPTNLKDGLTYVLNVVQDATGGHTMAWNTIWDFGDSGTPTMPTGAGRVLKVAAQYNSARAKLEVGGTGKYG